MNRTLTRNASEGERSTRHGIKDSVKRSPSLALLVSVLVLMAMPLAAAEPKAERVGDLFRPSDDRPLISKEQVKAFGIQIYESKHLRLFTDIDPNVAETLPPLVDQAFVAWENYFGKLPADEGNHEFQVNGYLIKDKARFEKAGLLRADLPDKFHGRQIGYQFWMMEQERDYYRRHLLLHEATHTFMRAITRHDLPLAYLEGMAEYFGTHRLADGKLRLPVMPYNRADFRGHDRLFLLRRDVGIRTQSQLGLPTICDLGEWGAGDFQFFQETYAWVWGMCVFFDRHPRTRDSFRETGRSLSDPQAWPKLLAKFKPDWSEITTEWNLFAVEAYEDFDFDRMAIDFRDGRPLSELTARGAKPFRVEVNSDKGWQSSGILVEQDRSYDVKAIGQFTLADKLGDRFKPWTSEADGITFRYHAGRPLGRLLATIRPKSALRDAITRADAGEIEPMFDILPLGSKVNFTAPRSGTLYLRLNDLPGELSDNRGGVSVELRLNEPAER